MKMKRLLSCILCLLVLFVFTCSVSANENEFQDLLLKLRSEDFLPDLSGEITNLGTHTEELAMIGNYSWYSLIDAENFVLSTTLSWDSGSEHPNNNQAGCGVVFGVNTDTLSHNMASVRLDGTVNVSGMNYTGFLKYGNTVYTQPTISGKAKVVFVRSGTNLRVYIDDVLTMERFNVANFGNKMGFSILSGTNMSFGTRCTWEDTFLYIF